MQGSSHGVISQLQLSFICSLAQQFDQLPLDYSLLYKKNSIFSLRTHVMWHFITFTMQPLTYDGSSACKAKQI